jgi:predicted AAA+ superfamily ATPase
MVKRDVYSTIENLLFKGKLIILTGARQVGKSTILKKIANDYRDKKVLFLNCDEPDIRFLLEGATSTSLKNLIGSHRLLLIDEAQRIEDIGTTLKLITDNISDVQVIVTGSSAFDLQNRLNEPLTGRKFEFSLYPFSTHELIRHSSLIEERRLLNHRLIYGMYPDVVTSPSDAKVLLTELTNSYLFKDIFTLKDIRNPDALNRLLLALALQVTSEVSYYELSRKLGIDKETVESYIELLEKVFVIFRVGSFSRNLRNELKKSKKIYFYDNGVRNTILNNFAPLELRNDTGALLENFLISERKKHLANIGELRNTYFWRTHSQQEIDLIEEIDGVLHAFEIKWNGKKKCKLPNSFSKAYPEHTFNVISPINYTDFVAK